MSSRENEELCAVCQGTGISGSKQGPLGEEEREICEDCGGTGYVSPHHVYEPTGDDNAKNNQI